MRKRVRAVVDLHSFEGMQTFVHIMDAEDNKIELWEQEIEEA